MANETTTTSAADVFLGYQVDRMILEEIRPRNVMRPLMRHAKLVESKSHRFPIQVSPGAASGQTEGTAMSNTAISTTNAAATAATVGMKATLTDELAAISIVDAFAQFNGVLIRSVLQKYETDFTALVNAFTNSTQTSGVDLTVDTFLTAVAALVGRDIPGPYVFVGHPVQTTDLQRDMATSTAANYAKDGTPNGLQMGDAGFQYSIGQVGVYQSSLVATANAGADRAGGIFVPNHTLGLAETWETRTETIRVPSLPGLEVDVTANYGVVDIRAGDGQTVTSDA